MKEKGQVLARIIRLPLLRFAVLAAALLCALCSGAQSTGRAVLKRQLEETIASIRAGETLTIRTNAARRLAELTRSIDPEEVDDPTLKELVSLLSTNEDSVRAWVAASLGHLGPRGKVAIPVLLKLLPEVDCLGGDLTSAPAIRRALERMGETPPPRPECRAASR
jgi:HEAT repeat protein